MIGVLLSGYSAYLSYTYLLKVKSDGLNVLQGWNQLKDFNDHLVVNFAGAGATLLALQVRGCGCVCLGGGCCGGQDVQSGMFQRVVSASRRQNSKGC